MPYSPFFVLVMGLMEFVFFFGWRYVHLGLFLKNFLLWFFCGDLVWKVSKLISLGFLTLPISPFIDLITRLMGVSPSF